MEPLSKQQLLNATDHLIKAIESIKNQSAITRVGLINELENSLKSPDSIYALREQIKNLKEGDKLSAKQLSDRLNSQPEVKLLDLLSLHVTLERAPIRLVNSINTLDKQTRRFYDNKKSLADPKKVTEHNWYVMSQLRNLWEAANKVANEQKSKLLSSRISEVASKSAPKVDENLRDLMQQKAQYEKEVKNKNAVQPATATMPAQSTQAKVSVRKRPVSESHARPPLQRQATEYHLMPKREKLSNEQKIIRRIREQEPETAIPSIKGLLALAKYNQHKPELISLWMNAVIAKTNKTQPRDATEVEEIIAYLAKNKNDKQVEKFHKQYGTKELDDLSKDIKRETRLNYIVKEFYDSENRFRTNMGKFADYFYEKDGTLKSNNAFMNPGKDLDESARLQFDNLLKPFKSLVSNPLAGEVNYKELPKAIERIGTMMGNDTVFSPMTECARNYKALLDFQEFAKTKGGLKAGIDIDFFAIQPIQRVPRYRLLLEDMLKSAGPSAQVVETALHQAKAQAIEINRQTTIVKDPISPSPTAKTPTEKVENVTPTPVAPKIETAKPANTAPSAGEAANARNSTRAEQKPKEKSSLGSLIFVLDEIINVLDTIKKQFGQLSGSATKNVSNDKQSASFGTTQNLFKAYRRPASDEKPKEEPTLASHRKKT